MSTRTEHSADGITAFEVEVKASQDFQTAGTTIRYEFGSPVKSSDMLEPHAYVEGLAKDLAWKRVEQLAAERDAKIQGEVERQTKQVQKAPSRAPVETATTAVEWSQASKPQNRGNFRFRPTSNLSTAALKAMITEAIREAGDDPELHAIYDERPGNKGIESGNKRYGFASVKPTEDNQAYEFMLREYNGKKYPKESYYVDFNKDGTVRVTTAGQYTQAAGQGSVDQVSAQARSDQAESEELPF